MKNLIYGFNDPENAIFCVYEGYRIASDGTIIIFARCDGGVIQAPIEMFKKLDD